MRHRLSRQRRDTAGAAGRTLLGVQQRLGTPAGQVVRPAAMLVQPTQPGLGEGREGLAAELRPLVVVGGHTGVLRRAGDVDHLHAVRQRCRPPDRREERRGAGHRRCRQEQLPWGVGLEQSRSLQAGKDGGRELGRCVGLLRRWWRPGALADLRTNGRTAERERVSGGAVEAGGRAAMLSRMHVSAASGTEFPLP